VQVLVADISSRQCASASHRLRRAVGPSQGGLVHAVAQRHAGEPVAALGMDGGVGRRRAGKEPTGGFQGLGHGMSSKV
jgi:hypothetical protein